MKDCQTETARDLNHAVSAADERSKNLQHLQGPGAGDVGKIEHTLTGHSFCVTKETNHADKWSDEAADMKDEFEDAASGRAEDIRLKHRAGLLNEFFLQFRNVSSHQV